MKTLIVIVAVAAVVIVLFSLLGVIQSRNLRRAVRALPPADRAFVADELEALTKMPLSTAEEEDAWYAASRSFIQRIGERCPDFASFVLTRFLPYLNDSDIFRRDPSHRVARERYILKFVHELRGDPQT